MTRDAMDWANLLTLSEIGGPREELFEALSGFYMSPDRHRVETMQPKIRIFMPLNKRNGVAKVSDGIQILSPYLRPAVEDYMLFDIRENSSWDIALHRLFVRQDLTTASVIRSLDGSEPHTVMHTGTVSDVLSFVQKNLTWSYDQSSFMTKPKRRSRKPNAPDVESDGEPQAGSSLRR